MRKFILSLAGFTLLLSAPPAFSETDIKVSGEIRLRPEQRDKQKFGSAEDDKSAYVGSRTRLTVDGKVAEDVIVKLTVADVRQWGQESQVNTAMEGEKIQALDVFEGYLQVNNIWDSPLSVKAGRQTLVYGDQRLLGHLGWKDEARTHDGLKVMLNFDPVKLDAFATKEAETGKPSDEKNDDDLQGAYAVAKLAEGITLDVYGIRWKTGGGDKKGKDVMTYGARADAKLGAFDATAEAAFQSGDWSEGVTQSANAFAVKAGFKPGILGSRIGVEYDFGSGDDNKSDATHKTFVFPFHTNHGHYGYMDYFSWGNMTDTRITLSLVPVDKVSVQLDYHMLTLDKAADDWYNVVGTSAFAAAVDGSDSTKAGNEIDLTVGYKALKNTTLTAGYSVFQPGEAAKQRFGKDKQSTWSYLMCEFLF